MKSMVILAISSMYDLVFYNSCFAHVCLHYTHSSGASCTHIYLPCCLMFLYTTSTPHSKIDLRTTLPLHLVHNVLWMLTLTSLRWHLHVLRYHILHMNLICCNCVSFWVFWYHLSFPELLDTYSYRTPNWLDVPTGEHPWAWTSTWLVSNWFESNML